MESPGRELIIGTAGHTVVRTGAGICVAYATRDDAVPAGRRNQDTDPFWIAGDIRFDDRHALIAGLKGAGRRCAPDDSDHILAIESFLAWGTRCVEHLLGDFAFVIYDREQRSVFAARDHFGVIPLYYARVGRQVAISNMIAPIRRLPGVSGELDESTIADLLIFGWKADLSRTSFKDIHAVPPAHRLIAERGSIVTERYWSVPIEEPVHYPRVRDYGDRFDVLFKSAVRDRVGSGTTTVLMSGGRDSTAIAWAAHDYARAEGGSRQIRAVTGVYDHDMPDEERTFATIAAQGIGIPIDVIPLDGFRMLDGLMPRVFRSPEPSLDAMPALTMTLLRAAAANGRVVLDGCGGDAIQRESESRIAHLVARGRVLKAVRESVQYLRWHRRLPRPGIRTYWTRLRKGVPRELSSFPPWLDAELVRRQGLRERWMEMTTSRSAHPTRPEAHWFISSPFWTSLFESQNAGATGIPLARRYPFMDVRIVSFLLSVPPAQWYNDKGLLRITMRGRLPNAIVDRPKAPLAGDPVEVQMRKFGNDWLRGATISKAAERFVRRDAVPVAFGGTSRSHSGGSSQALTPLMLSIWMGSQ